MNTPPSSPRRNKSEGAFGGMPPPNAFPNKWEAAVHLLVNYLADCGLSLHIQKIFRYEQIDADALDIMLRHDIDWIAHLPMTENDWIVLNTWSRLGGAHRWMSEVQDSGNSFTYATLTTVG